MGKANIYDGKKGSKEGAREREMEGVRVKTRKEEGRNAEESKKERADQRHARNTKTYCAP